MDLDEPEMDGLQGREDDGDEKASEDDARREEQKGSSRGNIEPVGNEDGMNDNNQQSQLAEVNGSANSASGEGGDVEKDNMQIQVMDLDQLPGFSDEGVRYHVRVIQDKLNLKHVTACLRLCADYLRIATLVLAMDADMLIKVQELQFDMIKLADAISLMLQSDQSGANNILEKLKIAYLYLQDGFPDFAKNDIEVISKDVKTMEEATQKCQEKIKTTRKALEQYLSVVKSLLSKLESELPRIEHVEIDPASDSDSDPESDTETEETKETSKVKLFCWAVFSSILYLPPLFFSKRVVKKERTRKRKRTNKRFRKLIPRPPYIPRKSVEERYKFELAALTIEKSLPLLDDMCTALTWATDLVNQWYTECKEIVEPNMQANINRAEGLSAEDKARYWDSLFFRREVKGYYARWRGLQVLCEENRPLLRRTRQLAENHYTENLYPREAVRKAWELAGQEPDTDIKELVKECEQELKKIKDTPPPSPPRTPSPATTPPGSPPPPTPPPKPRRSFKILAVGTSMTGAIAVYSIAVLHQLLLSSVYTVYPPEYPSLG